MNGNLPGKLLRRHRLAVLGLAAAVALAWAPAPAAAVSFGGGAWTVLWDTTLSYGVSYRLEDPDPRLIGIANGGTAFSVNGDHGNLNYGTGIFSNVFKLTSELDIKNNNGKFGAFVRFRGFYDYENEEGDRERTPLSDPALQLVGSRAQFLDHFIWFKFKLGSRPAELRLGDQVLSWGESTFIPNSINAINQVDVNALRVPGAELREALLPEGMAVFSLATSTNTSIEAYYQYDWGETKIDPPGSYFSTNDFVGDGGNVVFLGFGDSSDLAPYPLGGRPFLGVPRAADVRPEGDGQYGLAFRVFAPNMGGTEFGFYYLNYHSRLPIINGRTGTLGGAVTAQRMGAAGQAALVAFLTGASPGAAIAAGVATGAQIGLDPARSALVSQAAVSTALAGGDAAAAISALATDAYASTASYFITYPEDIELYGVSFNTSVGTMALQGEVSHRVDLPLAVDDVELLFAALGPISSGLAAFNQVGNFTGQFETLVPGFRELDVTQAQATLTKLFGPVLGGDQAVLLGEAAWTHVHSMPDKDVLRFEGPGTYVSGNTRLAPAAHAGKPAEAPEHFADADSWGYRLVGRVDYNNAIGAVNLSPRFSWQHDVSGVSPAPGGNFIEGRQALTLGIGADYQNTWQFDLSYTSYFGAGRYNLINDRDFVAANVKYSF